MAKAYIITEDDLKRLLAFVDRDPEHGHDGGSSQSSVNDFPNRIIYREAHGFYNYQVRKWIDEIKK